MPTTIYRPGRGYIVMPDPKPFSEFQAEDQALDPSELITVSFPYDQLLVELRRDAAPGARWNKESGIWRMRRDDAWNFFASADQQCRDRGTVMRITINGKTGEVGCSGAEDAAKKAAAEARAAERKAIEDERLRLERERLQIEEMERARRALAAAKLLQEAREVIATCTVGTKRFDVRTLDGDGRITAVLRFADGRKVSITNCCDSEKVAVSRRVSLRYLTVPVLDGGHSVVVTTDRPGRTSMTDVVRHEEVAQAA